MKKNKLSKEKIRVISIGAILFSSIFSGKVFATEFNVNLPDEYKVWNELTIEEKETTLMPQTNSAQVPENILNKYEVEDVPYLVNSLLGKKIGGFDNVSATVSNSRYSLADLLNLRVEHQGSTTECWAFATLKSMESNIAIENGLTDIPNFSERHADYATSRTFLDGINENGFNRELGNGGLPISALAYLTNGQGAVLEEEMPFEDNEEKINLTEIDKPVDTVVTDYQILPSIYKKYEIDGNGNTKSVSYFDVNGNEYSKEEVNALRDIIKEHLVKYGAIATMTAGNYSQYYNNQKNPFAATAYNCNDSSLIRDHAITIVGWDDNYSRDNFAEGAKPSEDGAYIVLNSYGTESFDNGYMYISYEDAIIENEMYGIQSTSKVDYDNIYQYDYYGGIYQVGTQSTKSGSYGVVYNKDNSEDEVLNSVGVTLADYAAFEVYVNPNGSSFRNENLIKVGESDGVLAPGYHRVDITPVELQEGDFSIVVKQTSEGEAFYFEVEASVPGTAYEFADSENRSYISLDGYNWVNLSSLSISGIDMDTADVCIKAFTTLGAKEENPDQTPDDDEKPNETPGEDDNQEPNEDEGGLTSNVYVIDNKYIMKISHGTKVKEFLNNIDTNLIKKVYNEQGTEITNSDEVLATGMKLKLSDSLEYTLIVRGDIKTDGILDLTDVSKLILHYNENKGFELSGNPLKAADMNLDGKIDLVDVSQMIVLYNAI